MLLLSTAVAQTLIQSTSSSSGILDNQLPSQISIQLSAKYPKATASTAPSGQLFTQWRHLLDKTVFFQDIILFIYQHPDWPSITRLQKKAEKLLTYQDATIRANDLVSKTRVDQMVAFFNAYPPLTGNGQFIYACALLSLGNADLAKEAFRKLLTDFTVPSDVLPSLQYYKHYLPFFWAYMQASHLLFKKNGKAAKLLVPYLKDDELQRVLIRVELIKKNSDYVQKAYNYINQNAKSPEKCQDIIFELARYHASFDKPDNDQQAFKLLTNYNFIDEARHPKVFWELRNKVARNLLSDNKPVDAYLVVKNHGYSQLNKIANQQSVCDEDCANAFCMTSWLALAYGKDPLFARSNLKEIEAVVKSPITKARIAYWLAETQMELNELGLAYNSLKEAARYKTTYYGQMAMGVLKNPKFSALSLPKDLVTIFDQNNLFPVIVPTEDEKKAFEALDLVRVIRSIPTAVEGENCDLFFDALLAIDDSLVFLHQVFMLAQKVKGHSYAVLLSRKKHMVFREAYPMLQPSTRASTIDILNPKSKYHDFLPALTVAVVRRESAFNATAVSGSKAIGLTQMLQTTALREAKAIKRFGISVSPNNLFDKSTNLLLGMSHLDGLLNEFGGSVVLALAAYNAGAAPVRRWINIYGDPRSPLIDPVNWIESIPYWETRNYVQRVLENLTIYEQLLAEEAGAPLNINLLKHLRPGI